MSEIIEGSEILVIGRTAPIPLGQQTADKSIPAVLASDQEPIPVIQTNTVVSEVALSLLGIPRSETALSLFADVTTYDVNPNEWQAATRSALDQPEVSLSNTQSGSAFEHLPSESAGRITSSTARNSSEYAILSSRRTFRYQPGRVSSATFGISASSSADPYDIKKWGAFDGFDGYYFEVQGGSQVNKNFNFFCVRRSSTFVNQVSPESGETGISGTNVLITRDGLSYVHAGLFDRSLRVSTGGVLVSTGSISFRVASIYAHTYEYRVPRRYFSYDRMDGSETQQAYYSDDAPGGTPFSITLAGTADAPVVNYADGTPVPGVFTDSVWDLEFRNVTMYKVEFSWYGAVGALFLAYVPDRNSPGDARWVRIHSLRCSNQFRTASLSNPFLPMLYYSSRGGQTESWVKKYGARFYIDGGDEGTIIVRSAANVGNISVTTTPIALFGLRLKTQINGIRNRMQVYPQRLGVSANGLMIVRLIKNPTVSGTPTWTTPDALSPVDTTITSGITLSGGRVVETFFVSTATEILLNQIFSYNRDYLSFPRTAATGDQLWIQVQSVTGSVTANCSLTWGEQS